MQCFAFIMCKNLADPCCQIRPTPPHLTSAMAENILAAACDSETRNAAKRMRLDVYQATVNALALWGEFALQGFGNMLGWPCIIDAKLHNINYNILPKLKTFNVSQDEPVSVDKPNSRDPASVAPSGFSISSAAFAQDQLYTNGGLNYSLRGYGTVGSNQQNSGAAQTNGEEPLSVRFNHIM